MKDNEPSISESEILSRQAAEAKAAAFEALSQAKAALEKNLDPRPVLRSHPWIAIASATVAGFVAVVLAVPSKQEQELQRLERLHRATHPDPAPPASGNGASTGNGQHAAPHQTIWASLIHELVQLIRPILLTAITSSIKGATPPQPPRNTTPPI